MPRQFRPCWVLFLAFSTTVCSTCGTDAPAPTAGPNPAALGISFIEGSTSILRMDRNGKTYEVDLVARSVREIDPPQSVPRQLRKAPR
jgi:hypothetical protein